MCIVVDLCTVIYSILSQTGTDGKRAQPLQYMYLTSICILSWKDQDYNTLSHVTLGHVSNKHKKGRLRGSLGFVTEMSMPNL